MIKSNGIEYEMATLPEQKIEFIKGERYCMACPYLQEWPFRYRNKCSITGEVIPHEDRMIGANCPLKFDEIF